MARTRLLPKHKEAAFENQLAGRRRIGSWQRRKCNRIPKPAEVLTYNEIMDRKLIHCFCISFWAILLSAALVSCSSQQKKTFRLASFVEHDVHVSIHLKHQSNGKYILEATFTPPHGYHLYSKDIPVTGIDGLGRPTLLGLTPNSRLKATGDLAESRKAVRPEFEPEELLVYPLGAVTLSLPIEVPPGDEWLDDELSVTYMACSASQCKMPVVNKIISVRIPAADTFDQK